MYEVAAHLTDRVLPHVPTRQWVLSVPKRLRPYLHHDVRVAGAVLQIFLRAIEHPCAATCLTGTYDPEARLLYWPTGNPCPDYNGEERKGDNLYSNSVVAIDPDTGQLRWYFKFTPHDLHDWDATETQLLVDAEFRGQPRKLLLHGERNGCFYVLDRLTGEFLLAEPFVSNLT